jgi:hypothetical protein
MNNQEKLFLTKEANRLITNMIAGLQPGAKKYQNLARGVLERSEGVNPGALLGGGPHDNLRALQNLAIGIKSVPPTAKGAMPRFAGQSYDKFRNIIETYMNGMPKNRSFGNFAQGV